MSSISVSAENLEAMLHPSNTRPSVESPRSAEHAASVSAEALEALLPAEKREHPEAAARRAEPGAAVAQTPVAKASVAEIPVPAAPKTAAPVAVTSIAHAPIATAPQAAAPVATVPMAAAPLAAAPRAAAPMAAAPVATAPMAAPPVVKDSKVATLEPPAPSAAGSKNSRDSKAASEPEPEVEETLPLLAARDRERVERPRSTQAALPTSRPIEMTRPLPQQARPTPLPSVAKAPAGGASAQRAANLPASEAESRPSANRTRTWLAIGAIVVALAGATVFFVRGRKTAPAVIAQPPILALQLGAETMGSGLVNVRWNPQSALVEKAKSGRLVIKEGDQQPRTVLLAQAELKTGHLLYQSPADRLEFRLETVEESGASTGETILVEVPKATDPGTPPQGSPGQSSAAQLARPNAGTAAAPTAASVPVEVQAATPQAPKSQAKAFTLPVQRRAEPARGVLLDAPGAVPGAAASVSLPSATLPGAFSAPPPPVAAAPAQPPRTGGDLQPAVLIRKIAPIYPPLAKAARIQGAVRFSATVGKDGHLQNLQVIGGHSALVQAATDAVKQWVYRPTLLNGEPVEVVTQLEVNFTLNESTR